MSNSNNTVRSFDDREHVRKRPGMYFVSHPITYQLLWEVVGEALAQCQQPGNNTISVTLFDDDVVSVAHDGESYFTDSQQDHIPDLQHVFTVRKSFYLIPREINGASFLHEMSVINAATRRLMVQTKFNDFLWQQDYEAGLPVTEVKRIAKLENRVDKGATIQFQPDFTIFEQHETHFWEVYWHLQLLSRCFCDIEFIVDDKRCNPETDEPLQVVDHMAAPPIHEPLFFETVPGGNEAYNIELQYRRTVYPHVETFYDDQTDLEQRYNVTFFTEKLRRYFNAFLCEGGNAPPDTLTISDICAGLSLSIKGWNKSSEPNYLIIWNRLPYADALDETVQSTLNNLRMDDPIVFFRILEKCLDNRHYRVSQQ